jgi:hypothetical protein
MILILIYLEFRASLHEEFGRKLMKHAKVGMGREETGYVYLNQNSDIYFSPFVLN